MTPAPPRHPLPMGSTVGMLGGGQLGRMSAMAAAQLGYRVHVFTPEPDSPGAQVAAASTVAWWDDRAALSAFAAAVDVVTLEWENVPVETLDFLAEQGAIVRPGRQVLAQTQDRLTEKRLAHRTGLGTAPVVAVDNAEMAVAALRELGGRGILKTRRMGYDGRGQARLGPGDDAAAAFAGLGGVPCVLEGFVNFSAEISTVVARGTDGLVAAYPPTLNWHEDGILRRSEAPAPVGADTARAATLAAFRLAEAVELVGVMAVEFFLAADGSLLVNELAPRPHNSGHWTLDACCVSQFDQHIRAVCGLPLGDPTPHSAAVMENLLGDEIDRVPALLSQSDTVVHLYGKSDPRPGRKMGHVTRLERNER